MKENLQSVLALVGKKTRGWGTCGEVGFDSQP